MFTVCIYMYTWVFHCSTRRKSFLSVSQAPVSKVFPLWFWLHSWATGEWGACSRSCGGGQQTRPLRCLRKVTYQREEVVAHSLCPIVSPGQIQPCQIQACLPEWNTGSWSQVGLWVRQWRQQWQLKVQAWWRDGSVVFHCPMRTV